MDCPAEMAFAWLIGMLVGMWAAVSVVFSLVDPQGLSIADMTVFSALLLFSHGLPIEQKIIQKAGPRIAVTTALRLIGGLIYAGMLCWIFTATGSLSETLDPVWIPMSGATGWAAFFAGLAETLVWMLVVFLGLAWLLEGLKLSGLMGVLNRALGPLFRLCGIHGDARQLSAVGLLLGVSYGGGLLIREARSGTIEPRQVFLSCVFMGFAHGVIEDTLLMVALGADFNALFFGRLVFSIAATALVAWGLRHVSEAAFAARLFDARQIAAR